MSITREDSKPDIIIVGAGITGLSIAYHLLQADPNLSLLILEKEKLLGLGSTGKCTGGIRFQFSSPHLRKLSMLSRDFFLNFEQVFEVPCWYRPRGYLMLAPQEGLWSEIQRTAEQAQAETVPIRLLEQEDLEKEFPFLQKGRYLGGTLGLWDAYADPYAVLAALFAAVRRRGVKVEFECEVKKIIRQGDNVKGVETTKGTIWSPLVVNAAGPYAAGLAASAYVNLPVRTFRRQVYVCTNPKDVPAPAPLIVDLESGFYLHQEASGKTVLLGGTDRDTRPGLEETIDKSQAEDFFTAAMETIPSCMNIKWIRTYVGIRELSPDDHPVLGEAPDLCGLFLAGGFGGHGFMHSPAVGQIMAELILKGESGQIDSRIFRPDRFAEFKLLESHVF